MHESPRVFVDIDTQRDFLSPEGALFIEGSEAILDNLARLTRYAREQRIPVLATACAHDPGDPEFRQFRPHCLRGTRGQERVEATRWPETVVLGQGDVFDGEPVAHLTIEKQHFDVFTNPAADAVVRAYNRDRPTFVVYGVATDYCVKAAILGLCKRDCAVIFVIDALYAINDEGVGRVCDEFLRSGATATTTVDVCRH